MRFTRPPSSLVWRGVTLGEINDYRRELGLAPLTMRDVESKSLAELVVLQHGLRRQVESGVDGGGLFRPLEENAAPGAGCGGPAPGDS